MNRLFLIIILVVLIVGSLYISFAGSSRPTDPPVRAASLGEPAPDFALQDTMGQRYRLSDLRGKVVMVNFWATWCPPCRAEMPSMEKLYETLKDDNFVMLAINIEENGRQTVPQYLQKSPHSFPVLYDDQGVVQKLYGVFKFPESFVIRKDGIIDDKVIGAIDWAHPETIAYFKDLLKG
ncbi:MAG: TlpA family protein disulfide reductase [Deltaproteobacteria bacterium]|jgi:peroxiredoxin|nr:TlpA family protein disulfide reductase [Deltaproteobacteria bacterium]